VVVSLLEGKKGSTALRGRNEVSRRDDEYGHIFGRDESFTIRPEKGVNRARSKCVFYLGRRNKGNRHAREKQKKKAGAQIYPKSRYSRRSVMT